MDIPVWQFLTLTMRAMIRFNGLAVDLAAERKMSSNFTFDVISKRAADQAPLWQAAQDLNIMSEIKL